MKIKKNPTICFFEIKKKNISKTKKTKKKISPQVYGLVWCFKFSLAQGKREKNTKLTKETIATPMCIRTNNARRTKTTRKKKNKQNK
jgi:hypothetical protein